MKPETLPAKMFAGIATQLEQADRVSLGSLIFANVLPILFALLFGWNLGGVVMIYWWENIIIGGYAVLRMLKAQQVPGAGGSGPPLKLFLVPFFCFHYFFFCLVHGVFLLVMVSFGSGGRDPMSSPFDHSWPGPLFIIPLFMNILSLAWESLPTGAILTILALIASHGISFLRNYIGKGEFERTSPPQEMFRPYGRIALLHVCIIFGGIATFVLGSPMILVILLIIGKTLMDAAIHSASHSGKSLFRLPLHQISSVE